MKKIICPHCGKEVKKIIGIRWKVLGMYNIENECGSVRDYVWDLAGRRRTERQKNNFQGFVCRFCYNSFPKKMERDIWQHLKIRKLLKKLKVEK